MDILMNHIQIQVNENMYLKDPNSSELGVKILVKGLSLIEEMGLEKFTFKKLGEELDTTESSIYRYFENKHKLLNYLISWYWGWMEYRLAFENNNIFDPRVKLSNGIKLLAKPKFSDSRSIGLDLHSLYEVLISESCKTYLTKEVDEINKAGYFMAYKQFVHGFVSIIQEINPNFKHPYTLVSTVIEGMHHQQYFADHIPSLTDFGKSDETLIEFYENLCLSLLKS